MNEIFKFHLNIPHRRPRCRRGLRAQQTYSESQLHLAVIELPSKTVVHRFPPQSRRQLIPYEIHQYQLFRLRLGLYRPPPTYNFKHQRPKGEDVGGSCGLTCSRQLRREVTKRSNHSRRARVRPAFVQLGEAKVAEAAIELTIKEDVAGLNVAVEDDALPFLVEIEQCCRHAANDAEANRPREYRCCCISAI
ncbi:hypothetical protein IEQ34_013352 [Dendrobium chrysotoxum]|uniref:Uncharacterized protein n=1 Tax=Dendrobium chrysotoxum TaxID=161865 RepID=A0AAV7GP07_DENCH|nr:hypothetical protein IEQ34_013352 [Dendrobium chrysotoxum]